MVVYVEYIWMDGHEPTQKLRSKTRVLRDRNEVNDASELDDWGFDGSSTNQAEGHDSDCALRPVSVYPDPVRGAPHVLAMCEVYLPDGETPHPSNTRAKLREAVETTKHEDPWFGIEQEYTMFRGMHPLGWPENGFPPPQGPYYCGVGADEVYGRPLVEEHMDACTKAGLAIHGINAEVMPAQWEFQIGTAGPLEVSDQLWIARWLLYRIGESHGITSTLHPKPVKGDWNGAGAHTNFSTKSTRSKGGMKVIERMMENLAENHEYHISNYGAHNQERLTGRHETCAYNTFRWGVSDRGASIRIPMATARAGMGYLEDRRPSANMDPYVVTRVILESCVLKQVQEAATPVTV